MSTKSKTIFCNYSPQNLLNGQSGITNLIPNMFDTIQINIYDLKEHSRLVDFLDHSALGKGHKVITVAESVEVQEKELELDVSARMRFRKIHHIHDKAMTFDSGFKGKLTSSHYDLAYLINNHRDRIEFNFSIPKYLYGTNIFQTMPHPNFDGKLYQKIWTLGIDEMPKYSKYFVGFLSNFLSQFFEREFGDIHIDFRFVELARIDCCFNMYFRDMEDAFDFLANSSKVAKKYTRRTSIKEHFMSGKSRSTVEFRGSNYHAKIYHKGTEFKEAIKGNPSNRQQLIDKNIAYWIIKGYSEKEARKKSMEGLFDIAFLQSMADSICRFEINFNHKYFNQVFKEGNANRPAVFRRDCQKWEMYMDIFKEVRSKNALLSTKENNIKKMYDNKRSEAISLGNHALIEKLNKEQARKIRKLNDERNKIDPTKRKIYVYVDKVLRRINRFYLDIEDRARDYDEDFNTKYENEMFTRGEFFHNKKSLFTGDILQMCIEKFVDFVKEFEIKERSHISFIAKKIRMDRLEDEKLKEHLKNAGIEKKFKSTLHENTFKKIIKELEFYDWDFSELKENVPKTTYYRYMKVLKEFGLYNAVKNDTSDFVQDYTFTPYYQQLMLNGHKVRSFSKPSMKVQFS